ncbi:MAG: 30S ribosomal protein S6 [Balneolaceae bacterium]
MKKFPYELLYILNPVLEDEKCNELKAHINSLIEENGGEIGETDDWGLRKFAYDIDGKGNGYYVNVWFTAPADAIQKLERAMRLHDDVMRYLTLKLDPKMLKHQEMKKKGEVPTIFEDVEESEEDNED